MQENIIRSVAKAAAETAVRNLLREYATYADTTTNATPLVIATIAPDLYTAGFLEVTVLGKDDLGVNGLRAKALVGYEKGSALTLDSPANIYPLVTEITGATYSITGSSGNILITVTGVASTTINWVIETKLITAIATNTP